MYKGIINNYSKFMSVTKDTPAVTLQEGNTILTRAVNLEKYLQTDVSIYLKFEGQNPTGSFKDRGMTLAVSKAVEEGTKGVVCASTGNTSASASAFAAKAGIDCFVLVPKGKVSLGKLSQALIYGAKVLNVDGNFDDCLTIVKELTESGPLTLVNSINPYRLEGQKTGAFEVCDDLKEAPDHLFIPVGNAGNISAYWQGFKEYYQAGYVSSLPSMWGFQSEGAAPLVYNKDKIDNPETVATAIRIGNPANKDKALTAVAESNGELQAVSDDDILAAYQLVAQLEGIFVEPASAASIAGVIRAVKEDRLDPSDTVVCVLTGHGLKDPDRAVEVSNQPIEVLPELSSIKEVMLGGVENDR